MERLSRSILHLIPPPFKERELFDDFLNNNYYTDCWNQHEPRNYFWTIAKRFTQTKYVIIPTWSVSLAFSVSRKKNELVSKQQKLSLKATVGMIVV